MPEIIRHYGPAILALVAIALIAMVLYGLYQSGFLTTQAENLVTQTFTNMNGFIPTPTPPVVTP